VFQRTGTTWAQQAYVKPLNPEAYDWFGYAVALSADGDTLAVGAVYAGGDATGINGPDNDGATQSGAAYVFQRTGATWQQQAYVKASNTRPGDWFGCSVALSASGETLAVGAKHVSGSGTGIDPPDDNTSQYSGAAYLY
jgi:hypothetical protein